MLLQINKVDFWVKLIGSFNAYNILSVYAVAKQFGWEDYDLLTALSMLNRFMVDLNLLEMKSQLQELLIMLILMMH